VQALFCRLRQSSEFGSPLAARAGAKEFKLVRHSGKIMGCSQAQFNLAQEAFLDFHDRRAARANQMMVMAVVTLADQFKPRRAVPEIEPPDNIHFFEQVQRAINCCQIALALGRDGENFLARQWMRMFAQNFQNRLAWTGDFARLTAQSSGQRGHFLPLRRMGMGVCFQAVIRLQIGRNCADIISIRTDFVSI